MVIERCCVSVVYVSQLLGHEDLESTSIYLHPSQYEAIEKVRSVDLFRVQNPADSHSMDRRGFEPRASSMPRKRSTSDLPAPARVRLD